MANSNTPVGLTAVSYVSKPRGYTSGGVFAKGDLLARVPGNGRVVLFVEGTHRRAIGVAGNACTGAGQDVLVFDDPFCDFWIQGSGTYVKATHDLQRFDVTGGTGVQQANLSARKNGTLLVLGHHPITESTEVGAYSKLRVRIAMHEHLDQGDTETKCKIFEDFLADAGATLPTPWGKQDTSAAGSPTADYVADLANGGYRLATDATDEVQTLTLYLADQLVIDPTKNPKFKCRLRINSAGAALTAPERLVVGLASARNATLNSIASNLWFRFEGANNNIFIEGDDGTTDTDDTDTTIDYVDNTWMTLEIDASDLSAVRFYVDGVLVATTIAVSALAAANVLQPYIELQKDSGTAVETVDIDFVEVSWDR